MRHGLLSIALTMDVKSFLPPHRNGINYGELGGRSFEIEKARPKRAYISDGGATIGCQSARKTVAPNLNLPKHSQSSYAFTSMGNGRHRSSSQTLHNRRGESRDRVGAGLYRNLEAPLTGSVRSDGADTADAGFAQER